MKIRFFVVILIVVSLASGCANGEKKESKLSLDTVVQAIKAEGPELISQGQLDYGFAVINDVKPHLFSIGNQLEDIARHENIYIYFFDSEQARKDGLNTFNQYLKANDLALYQFAYEQKNMLIIYYSSKYEDSKVDEKIQTAIQTLN
ncbi:hypothetical protein [Paenibacillus prosopidis]|uniref:DUF4358 domain-containing protein n=1 Tax=Paenibacillus prosopidis TaxID=630520 RepID=A0A368VM25_9BACL|nr:hypothetical protein [Paenibacillus prosopidis]RCW40080.1 hypothetical protein DFP97_1432 [Paenibacillus prosopidis]